MRASTGTKTIQSLLDFLAVSKPSVWLPSLIKRKKSSVKRNILLAQKHHPTGNKSTHTHFSIILARFSPSGLEFPSGTQQRKQSSAGQMCEHKTRIMLLLPLHIKLGAVFRVNQIVRGRGHKDNKKKKNSRMLRVPPSCAELFSFFNFH